MEIQQSLSKMGLLGALQFSLLLVSLSQIPYTTAQVCSTQITSINSPGASSLRVKWSAYSGATNYLLDLRVIDVANVAPVVVTLPATTTDKVVYGLRPGTFYTVTVKVFRFYYVMCLDTQEASTVPATSQITSSRALSSTSIRVEWARVYNSDRYHLLVSATGEKYNLTFTNLSAVVENLQPSTAYDCYVYTANSAGLGASSRVRTIYTLVQPPAGVTAVQTGKRSARVSWQPVNRVLLYEVTVKALDRPDSVPFVTNVTTTGLDVQNILPCSSYRISVSSVNAFLEPGDSTDYVYSTKTLSPVTTISVEYSCTSGSATVSWGAVYGADSYRASAMGSNGTALNCSSQGTQCQITGVGCGQSYVVRVTALSASCESEISNATTTFDTVPCSPENLTLFRECRSNVIIFSWTHASSASFYIARAVDSAGVRMECLTTDDRCYFTDTVCGRQYNFTVNAVSGDCNSPTSPSVGIRTAPCMPTNVVTSTECATDTLTTTWNPAEGALYYRVEAWGNKGVSNRFNCSSTSTSCSMPDVHCGQHFTVYITAFDDCPSTRTLGQVAETVPCVPQNLTASMDCGADSVTLNWGQTYGALFYTATAMDAAGVTHTCNSMEPRCQITGLRCSSTYTAYVTASNFQCNGSASQTVSVETAPCPPDQIVAILDCATNEVLVAWQGHHQLPSYTATMEDSSGALLSCSTTGNNCTITSLQCGQHYAVSVMHHDGICPSMPSKAIYLESVPCGPANVQPVVDCESGVLTVNWDKTTGAEAYTTCITDSQGNLLYCNSTETHCSVNTLECGEEYVVEVKSVNGTCLSMPSQSMTVREVPCVPTNVMAERTCGESSVNVTWEASRGAESYVAVCLGNNGHRTECSSNGTACRIDDLQCGQVYNISVMAVDHYCSSLASSMVTLQTVPCPPTNVSGSVDCGSNTASLTWAASPNAVAYSGKAVCTHGDTVTCEATTPGCQLTGLNCGQSYVFTVSASDGSCESPDSQEFSLETAPCAPENVNAELQCEPDVLAVSWEVRRETVAYYLCFEFTSKWLNVSYYYNSTQTQYSLPQPKCGGVYTVTVQAGDGTCNSTAVSTTIETAPCAPSNVLGVMECESNALRASWGAAYGALAYVSTLTGPDNYSLSCSTHGLSCSFPGLECAQQYNLSVVASNNQCNSSVSDSVSVTTAPCAPANVTADLQCEADAIVVSWGHRPWAIRPITQIYVICVEFHSWYYHYSFYYLSVETNYRFSELKCGGVYTITVQAGDGTCNSTAISTTIKTAPCAPVIQHPTLDCYSNQASVSWAPDEYAVGFHVNATSALGHATYCDSANTSCLLDDLLCGQTYTVSAVAQGDQCPSVASEAHNIVTAPCTPSNVQSQYTCGTSIALLSWDETLGRESFYASVQYGNDTDSCSTTGTGCSLTTLECGRLYDVRVDAIAGQCNSSQPGTAQLQTAPCAPQNVSASLVCADNTAAVTWLASPGAVRYNVSAVGRNGDVKLCSTDGTSCYLPNMQCGVIYSITVTPYSESCGGFQSTTILFTSGPCPPTDVQVSLECEDNVGSVSWAPALAADLYVATATGDDGHSHTCTTDGTGCSFGDLHCGESYAVTVVTVSRGCESDPSAPVTLRAALCPPGNLTGETDCVTNDLTVTWDPSPAAGATYILYSQEEGGANASYPTTETSYVKTGLQCGQDYTFRVAARDSECTSGLSPPLEISTAPCTPTNISAEVKCGTRQTVIRWDSSAGAVTYTATVSGSGGPVTSCTSSSNYCVVRLDCGHHYYAALVASTDACNSTVSPSVQFYSAPCLPEDVQATLDCAQNTLAVQWQASQGDPETYTALAVGSDGSRSTCNTSSSACTIQGLRCGLTYSVAVTTASVDCGTIDVTDYMIQSAPCMPEHPTLDLDCSTNVVDVAWENAGPDQYYVVSAVTMRGVTTTCNSTDSNCTFSQLSCGEAYTFSVVGMTQTCSSNPTADLQKYMAPCVPTHVTAGVDCETGIVSVTWDLDRGAHDYTVYAKSDDGSTAECSNTDMFCTFADLECGQNYTLEVVANPGSCSSLASEPITITTVPCRQTGLQATLDCSSNTALVSWTLSDGVLSYNASAEDSGMTQLLTCATSGSSCNISSLQCGERYRVSVRGEGLTCPSPAREWAHLSSAPCPPTELGVQFFCDSDNISVSWATSKGSLSYTAVAESKYGHVLSCNTSGTSCNIGGLLCGQRYEVYAAGVDENCVGAKSEVEVIYTAPCVPAGVQTDLDCPAGVLTVTWEKTHNISCRPGAQSYRTTVQSSEGHVSVCDSEEPVCVVADIQCGLTYSVVVMAQDEGCNSSLSPVQLVTAAPCLPDNITGYCPFSFWCGWLMSMVTWNNSVAGVLYNATAVNQNGHYATCSATETGCSLNNLECGSEYHMTVTPSRDGCVGVNSPSQLFRTAPCAPVLVEVEMDCLSDSAWVTWEESAGAEFYVAVATDSHGQTFECNSTDSTCAVSGLQCGQNFTFTVTAFNELCQSNVSNAVMSETAPCAPEDVLVDVSCENGSLSVWWAPSYGALTYTATLERTDKQTTCCYTNETHCDITDLPCGRMYMLVVVAEGRTCNSSQSMGTLVRTVPCTPQSLQASLSCSSNVATVTWSSSGDGQRYSVQATGTDGDTAECLSYDNSCDLTTLRCGELYTATVVAEDGACTSPTSDAVEIKTVPCTPANVYTLVNCTANCVSVNWTESAGADSYTATVEDSAGHSTTCQAMSEGSCHVDGLRCGEPYRVTVLASDGYCSSPPTEVTDFVSAPCEPSHITAVFDCQSGIALVSWSMSAGAVSYAATAVTASGHAVTCQTNDTNCELGGLACGESYSVSVHAYGEWPCSRVGVMNGQLITEPCVPRHVNTQYSVRIAQVFWDVSKGANSYAAEAVTDQGLRSACRTNDSSCALLDMACSQVYNVSVTADNQVCQGVARSDSVSLKTEPCPPANVQTGLDCETATGTVSWEASVGAVSYMVYLRGRSGESLSCHTYTTYCSLEGLSCGEVYVATVTALGETLNSTESQSVLLVSAPCTPANVVVEVDCKNDKAMLSWDWSDGATSYLLVATSRDGHRASCETENHYCNITELPCGQYYDLNLTTINDNCQVEVATGASFHTRPCAPQRVGVDLQCGNQTATLSWEQEEGVEYYMASASCDLGVTTEYCNSTGSSCQFSGLDCGRTYSFFVVAFSCAPSEVSSTVEIETEPCQVDHLTAEGTCENETVTLAWGEAKGVSVYVLTAVGDLGYETAFQTNDTTLETALPCGQTYTFSVTGQDDRCDSPASNTAEFTTAPCTPMYLESYVQCEDSLGSISWAESDGAESYTAVAVGQDGQTYMCNTNTTSCTWSDLRCGGLYVIHVISNHYLCSSLPSNSTSIRTAPCVPQNLTSSLDCETRVASLTWDPSAAADSYIVTAETNDGHKVEQSTNETNALISELKCSEEYFLSVQAVDSVCRSAASLPARQKTEPCPPTHVSSDMDCLSNIAVVTWEASEGAEFYTATVRYEGSQETSSCMSASTQCGMSNLDCGLNYTVTVTATNSLCESAPSEDSDLDSVPCVPTDVKAVTECSDNTVRVSWSPSLGALSYIAVAKTPAGVEASSCESTSPQCTLTGLACGSMFYVNVIAVDNNCSSLPSQSAEFHTVPCTPVIGAVLLDCYTDSFLLDWTYADGAVNYTATAVAAGGLKSSCSGNYTNCELPELTCGQTYTITVVASDGQCDSFPSASVEAASVPCPPEDVVTELDCSSNSATVQWAAANGADSYVVQAFSLEGYTTGCTTEGQECVVPDLMCGHTYNISVIAVSNECNVSESAVTQLQTAPCVPNQVDASLDCESGVVSVSWEPSYGATLYLAVAQGNGGYASSCNTSGTVCSFSELLCGLSYSITVSASDDTCVSAESGAVQVNTVPCEPLNVTAELDCSSDTGIVSWEQGESVSSYMVYAVGPDGQRIHCSSNATSCRLPGLNCGQLYNLTVTALDGVCDNSKTYLTLQSAPCNPTNVQASLRCRSNSVAVTWERASGAASYQAVGTTVDGSYEAVCNNNLTFCDLTGLYCGQTYNVTVFAQDESCSSAESGGLYVATAPCPPQDVAVDVQCAAGSMLVMWSANPDADSFHVKATTDDGADLMCYSTGTNCSIEDMPCGRAYSVSVISVRDGCESEPSDAVQVSSAPCVPMNLEGSLDCVTNSAWMSWQPSDGAKTYTVIANGVGGHYASCTTSSTQCNVPDLACGTLYTFYVIATNAFCNSTASNTVEIETGPCALTTITAETDCYSSTILVGWELTEEAPLYLVTAEGDDRSLISCNSTMDSCELMGVLCGTHYTIIVSASSDKCSSLRSPPHKISTAPCTPEDVAVTATCEDDGVVVSWQRSAVAQSYLLTATGRDGDVRTCNTSVSNCTLTELNCGQPYTYSVTASADNCTSHASADVTFNTVPCDPTGLSVDLQCETNSAVLSWAASEGSVEYYGCAASEDGDEVYCNSMDTSCTVEGLECGAMYNFSVMASDGVCNSSFSEPLLEGAAPCAPDSVSVRLYLTLYLAVSWSAVECPGVTYLVELTGRLQDDPQALIQVSSYWTALTYFEFPLPCGTYYSVTVRSRNSAGVSGPSVVVTGMTVPCPPLAVTFRGDNMSAELSWEASVFAEEYNVYDVTAGGRLRVCNTQQLSCELTNVEPGAIEVTASNAVGESVPTKDINEANRRRRSLAESRVLGGLHQLDELSVPEVQVITVMDTSLYVVWTPVRGADYYTVVIQGPPNQRLASTVLKVADTFTTVGNLDPSTRYCIVLSAGNNRAQSSYSRPECATTSGVTN